jgi:signal transduction histidine kinase
LRTDRLAALRRGTRRLLVAPVFAGDEDRTLRASLLHPILLSVLLGVAIYALVAPVHRDRRTLAYAYCGALGLLAAMLLVAERRGHVRGASATLVVGVWLALVSGASLSGGVLAASFSGLLIAVLCAGVLLGPAPALLLAALSTLAGALFLRNPSPVPGSPDNIRQQAFLAQAVYMVVAAVLLSAVMRAMRAALDRARAEARERREALDRLRLAQEAREALIGQLEAKNAELESFTYTVSHDLRTPLVTVKGFASHLAQDLQAGDTARAAADVARIQRAAERMDRLMAELLELSRVGRVVRPFEDLDLGAIVREALDLLQGRLAEGAASVEVAPELPRIRGDRARLVLVMQNLIDNALKFGAGQPELRIQIGHRPAAGGRPPVVYLRDNGPGIPPDQLETIFTLFRRLDPKAEGTGIGLALARRIVELHGGRIWAESDGPGTGATFCLALPEPARP